MHFNVGGGFWEGVFIIWGTANGLKTIRNSKIKLSESKVKVMEMMDR